MKIATGVVEKVNTFSTFLLKRKTQAIGLATFVLGINVLLGLGRDSLLAAAYGATEELDAFLLGFNTVKAFGIRIVMATAGAMVPVIVPLIVSGEISTLAKVARRWMLLVALFLLLLTSLMLPNSSNVAAILAPGFSPSGLDVLSEVVAGLLPLLLVFAIAGLSKSLGDSYDSYAIYPLLLTAMTVGLILSVFFFRENWGIMAAVIGTVLGAIVGLFLQWYLIRRQTPFRFGILQPTASEVTKLPIPYFAFIVLFSSSIVVQIQGLVERAAVSHLPPGSMSALSLALSVLALPVTLLLPVATSVLLPYLVRQSARTGLFIGLPQKPLAIAIVIILFGQIVIWIFSDIIVNLLFLRGEFTIDAASLTADTLRWMSLSTGLFLLGSLLRQVVIANRLVWHDFLISLFTLFVEIPLLAALVPLWGLRGLAIVSVIAMSLNVLLYYISIKSSARVANQEATRFDLPS